MMSIALVKIFDEIDKNRVGDHSECFLSARSHTNAWYTGFGGTHQNRSEIVMDRKYAIPAACHLVRKAYPLKGIKRRSVFCKIKEITPKKKKRGEKTQALQ
jgi:hypothetical protein